MIRLLTAATRMASGRVTERWRPTETPGAMRDDELRPACRGARAELAARRASDCVQCVAAAAHHGTAELRYALRSLAGRARGCGCAAGSGRAGIWAPGSFGSDCACPS